MRLSEKFGMLSGIAGIAVLMMVAGCGEGSSSATGTNGVGNAVSSSNAVASTNAVSGEAKKLESELKKLGSGQPVIRSFSVEDLCTVNVNMAAEPDFTRLRDFIDTVPKTTLKDFNWWDWRDRLELIFDLKPAVEYSVYFRKGLPFKDGRKLEQDCVVKFTAPDLPPDVSFAHSGRYLPSVGKKLVELEAVNVTNLTSTVYSVPPQNVIQLLAREECMYRIDDWHNGHGRSMDSADTIDLSHGSYTQRVVKANAPRNVPWKAHVQLGVGAKPVSNGIYLVRTYHEGQASEQKEIFAKRFLSDHAEHKLVCVTDIALTMRRTNSGKWHAWATSLSTGRPLKDISVQIYSFANVMLGDGMTDENGRCDCEIVEEAEPFAAIAEAADGSDCVFMSLMKPLEEEDKAARAHLTGTKAEAFVWTERGIYRHNEKIMAQAILRNHGAKAVRFPVQLEFREPGGETFLKKSAMPDANGVVTVEEFAVPDYKPSGTWSIVAKTPGENGVELGGTKVKIEEFVPPQIRVKTEVSKESTLTNVQFTVEAEHLFGGPAIGLPSEAALMVKDAPFAPAGWEGWLFGDETRKTPPNFLKKPQQMLDNIGKTTFVHNFGGKFHPSAAMEVSVQGMVFEKGGRMAVARGKTVVHEYPAYVGVQMGASMLRNANGGSAKITLVAPDGKQFRKAMRLKCRIEALEWVYSVQVTENGGYEWTSDRISTELDVSGSIELDANGEGTVKLPLEKTGEYMLRLWSDEENVCFGKMFKVCGNSSEMSASMANPFKVKVTADKRKYYIGEKPKLTLKSPFTGVAWLQVLNRDDIVHSEVLELTNATSEVTLPAATAEWLPGAYVSVSVVQAARARRTFTPNRASGTHQFSVTSREREIPVKVTALVTPNPEGGSILMAKLDCTNGIKSATATVTVVDEAINMLTAQKTPDPVGWFAVIRQSLHSAFDIYNRLLPVIGDPVRNDAKTGGDTESDLFGRVSLQPSRRFKPLSTWKLNVPVKDGKGEASFVLPEFAGEVRVTAVVCSEWATGSGAAQAKVAPGLVMRPDGPRFMSPEDRCVCTLSLYNRTKAGGKVAWEVAASGAVAIDGATSGEVKIAKDGSVVIEIPVKGSGGVGEGEIRFTVKGLGEKHTDTICMPVRAGAMAQTETFTKLIAPGDSFTVPNGSEKYPEHTARTLIVSSNGVVQLSAALKHLADYPYGCLEQTVSQMFPLIAAGGTLNALPVSKEGAVPEEKTAANVQSVMQAGVTRVCSMLRGDGTRFSMWPDSNEPPWNDEVTVWAAYFLAYARKNTSLQSSGWVAVKVREILRKCASTMNAKMAAYACYALADVGESVRERALAVLDAMEKNPSDFSDVDRSRIAGAYAAMGDRVKAAEIAKKLSPSKTEEYAWAIMALLRIDPLDERIDEYARRLLANRDKRCGHWLTTGANATTLMALAEYFRVRGAGEGEMKAAYGIGPEMVEAKANKAYRAIGGGDFVVTNRGSVAVYASVSRMAIPEPDTATTVSNGIAVARRFLDEKGAEIALENLKRGDMAVVELTLTGTPKREYRDLVIVDLLPACFEPEQRFEFDERLIRKEGELSDLKWELRREMRDDRALIFGKPLVMDGEKAVRCFYAVRVVTKGKFTLPGTTVEAMYEPEIHARLPAGTIEIKE